MKEKELIELKAQIEAAKTKVAGLKGKREAIMDSLKNDYGCKTVAEAQKLVKSMEKEVSELQERIESTVSEIEDKYHFDLE